MRVLLLGGTGEARALADALADRPDIELTSSLAGRVSNPTLPVGAVRMGGFGGTEKLAAYLRDERIDRVVDATHPFAATITAHAEKAARDADVPLLVLRRPGWTEQPDDDWTRVPDITSAAAATAQAPPGCVFVTTGRRDLAAYATDDMHHHLVRAVDPPDPPMPPHTTVLLDRGPYTVEGETELMRTHGVVIIATKDSGGPMTFAKLVAARTLGIPVVVVDRPAVPDGVQTVDSIAAATAWLDTGAV